jgi:hypothetical protein
MFIQVLIEVNRAPRGGFVYVNPMAGNMQTQFTLSALAWFDEHTPLRFGWSASVGSLDLRIRDTNLTTISVSGHEAFYERSRYAVESQRCGVVAIMIYNSPCSRLVRT